MAGMLPGVETARRRRLHGSCDPSTAVIGSGYGSLRSTRQLSHDTHFTPTSFLQRSMVNQLDDDYKLGGVAREAKERLDGRLRGHLKQDISRNNGQERLSGGGRRTTSTPIVMENFVLKKNGLKRLRWGRMGLSWKTSKQDDCAICLDQYKASEKISLLPCTHRFHSDCLLPWLESNAHCPCCRATIFCSN
uniref:probable E3 ubiquitin-protein ligase RHY1A n=1 Tax=Erigeron canadensis TaxID=72917 RepID=UPI001CB8DD0B|nr:probable E3 ubiquitin-protein ligase RHY1A [Erigeron canadensis]